MPRSRIVLAGFSQGGAITLQTGLRQREPLAGLLALSTYLPLAAAFEAERAPASRGVPIFMAHGRSDPVIPLARATASRDAAEGGRLRRSNGTSTRCRTRCAQKRSGTSPAFLSACSPERSATVEAPGARPGDRQHQQAAGDSEVLHEDNLLHPLLRRRASPSSCGTAMPSPDRRAPAQAPPSASCSRRSARCLHPVSRMIGRCRGHLRQRQANRTDVADRTGEAGADLAVAGNDETSRRAGRAQ